jgi:hypothetical protein
MQDSVYDMRWSGIYAEQLAIQHVGEGGERMPIACVEAGERPDDAATIQTTGDMTRPINVIAIIVSNPVKVRGLSENGPNKHRQPNADNKF